MYCHLGERKNKNRDETKTKTYKQGWAKKQGAEKSFSKESFLKGL
jgi:hypothetical protein